MSNVSVIILTKNEEKHLTRCIESVLGFSDSVYVIDSYSDDDTIHIAESLGAKVIQHQWPGNHAKQFQWALEHCLIETEWVMKMDADEFILPQLQTEIAEKLCSLPADVSGIYLKRRVFFMGKWIKHGGYYPTWLLRIWRYKDGRMEQRWMDEHIVLESGKSIQFEGDIVDDNLNNLTWWTDKHNHYATREAIDRILSENVNGVKKRLWGTQEERKRLLKYWYNTLPIGFGPALYFFYRFIFRLGFLDGVRGALWHLLQGFWYRLLVDAKYFDIKKRAKGQTIEEYRHVIKEIYGVKLDD